jgi:hypothetical protein
VESLEFLVFLPCSVRTADFGKSFFTCVCFRHRSGFVWTWCTVVYFSFSSFIVMFYLVAIPLPCFYHPSLFFFPPMKFAEQGNGSHKNVRLRDSIRTVSLLSLCPLLSPAVGCLYWFRFCSFSLAFGLGRCI